MRHKQKEGHKLPYFSSKGIFETILRMENTGGDKFMKKLKDLFTIIRMQTLSEVNLGPWKF